MATGASTLRTPSPFWTRRTSSSSTRRKDACTTSRPPGRTFT
ncbi:hypothetical protein CSUB01_07362 [Colletotrichum sublineola]|uniref:Uncharacterized protein n=1 Tax=Colletotrichum sublineola TaxID=1173701 RepID=A0A066XAE0_COLSU|nr:hypothetical protein CSUB01_07362 [Colletotrichum sublineola]